MTFLLFFTNMFFTPLQPILPLHHPLASSSLCILLNKKAVGVSMVLGPKDGKQEAEEKHHQAQAN